MSDSAPQKQPVIRAFWHELYIELLASPLDQRTDREFCEENKLHANTLSAWKRSNRKAIYDEVQRRRVLYLNEMRSVAYKQLNALCKKDVNAVKLMFQLTGDLVEQSKTTVEYMSRQDKIDRVENLLKEAHEKSKTWKKIKEAQNAEGSINAVPNDSGVSDGTSVDGPGKDHA